MTTKHSCLQCKFYPRCNDPQKSRHYVCEDFKQQEIQAGSSILQTSARTNITPTIETEEDYEKQELGLVKMLDSILQPGSMVPFDLKIDDRDLKEFPNFYSFCFSKDGADQAPYARQLAVATHLLAEWCPDCSSPAFKDINRVPVGYPAIDFPDKVQFLYYGKCPKCGTTKSELVKQHKLNPYQELAACVTGDTLVQTEDGLQPIKELKGYQGKIFTGKGWRKQTNWFDQGYRNVWRVITGGGHSILATLDHKFCVVPEGYLPSVGYLPSNWKELEQITVGDCFLIWPTEKDWVLPVVEKVVSIVEIGEEHVYDIEVEDHHSFIANSILVHNCIGQRGGKCLEGSTLILTETGIIPIRNLSVGKDFGFTPMDCGIVLEDGSISHTSHFYKEKKEKTITIRLNNGMYVRGTHNHPIKTIRGFVPLKNIRQDTLVPIHVGQNIWSTCVPSLQVVAEKAEESFNEFLLNTKRPDLVNTQHSYYCGVLTEDIAKLLGFIVSEGSAGRVSITNTDPNVLSLCENTLLQLLSTRVKVTETYVESRYKVSYLYLDQLMSGKLGVKSADREIPPIILQSPRRIVASFMSALFEGDGGFNGSKLEYCTISKTLSHQVQVILSNFGVISKIYRIDTWATNGSKNQVSKKGYIVSIVGPQQLLRFRESIGFFSKRKSFLLDRYIYTSLYSEKDMPFWYDKYPQPVKTAFIQLLGMVKQDLGKHRHYSNKAQYGFNSVLGLDHNSDVNRIPSNNVALSRQRILRTAEYLKPWRYYLSNITLKVLDKLVRVAQNTNLYYAQVENITYHDEPTVTYDVSVPQHHRFMANGLLNHNSAISSLIAAYLLHKYLKLQKPNEVFGLMRNNILVGTVAALTYGKAVELLWLPIQSVISNSKWFTDYHAMLDSYADKYGDEELYKFKDTIIHYKHRGLLFHPSGPSKRTMRGATRFLSLIDELGWFDNSEEGSHKERASATEVYTALDRSLKTVRNKARKLLEAGFNNVPTAYAIDISSPSSQTDKIMSLVRTHAGSREVYTVHLPTWKFNPEYKRSDFAKEYRDNPINAERDFGANPPMSENPFIYDVGKLKGLLLRQTNKVQYKYVVTKTLGRDKSEKHGKLLKVNVGNVVPRSVMAIDAGVSNNSFALSVGHVTEKDGIYYRIIDTMIEIAPRRNQDEINFARVSTELIEPIIEELNVGWVIADRWNSIKLLDDLRENCGVETAQYSLKYSDLMYVREFLTEESPSVRIPKVEMAYEEIMHVDLEKYPHCFRYQPVSHFIFQCGTVVDWGNSVQKGSGLTDDLFRSTSLCLTYLLDAEFVEQNLLNKDETKGKRFLGVFAGASSGASSGGTASNNANLGKIGAIVSRGGSH